MDEYINKVAFNYAIRDAVKKYPNSFYNGLEVARQIAHDFPAADVRPVVLCRDCKHWDVDWVPTHAKENEHFCPIVALTTRNDWFCADGEKEESR